MNIKRMIDNILGVASAALKSAKTANERIDNLPKPLAPMGTLGTGGTIESLPTASADNYGYYYVVITDGTYAGQAMKAGDTTFSNGTAWVLVPSADEPSPIDDSVTSTALTWSSDKIERECKVKSFTYTGNGQLVNTITIPTDLKFIVAIGNLYNDGASQSILSNIIIRNNTVLAQSHITANTGTSYTNVSCRVRWEDNVMKLAANNTVASCFNESDVEYTVYYI